VPVSEDPPGVKNISNQQYSVRRSTKKEKMMKYLPVYALLLLFVFVTSFKGQNNGAPPKDKIRSNTSVAITSHGSNNSTRTIRQDRKGNIWIASLEGIIRYDGKSFTNMTGKVTSSPFVSVLEDRKGNFWFASMGSGVYYYDGKSFRNLTTREGLASNRVTCMYEDRTGNIWFGTPSGPSRYDGKSFHNYCIAADKTWAFLVNFTTREGLAHNDVTSILEDRTGKLWFGTRGNACVYDGKSFTTFTHYGKPFKNVRSIIEDKNGHIWLGGNDGLWRYEGSAFANPGSPVTSFGSTFTNFTRDFVGYVYEDKKGNIWTSSLSADDQRWALSRYDVHSLTGAGGTAAEIKAPKATMLFGVLEHEDGSIWFDTIDGVYRYDETPAKDYWKLVVPVRHGGC
jgi:ligand-binding sensor domain-containing protein